MIRRWHSRGFTLIELLIVVALIAIVLTLAAPSFSRMILMQRLKSISAQITTDLQFARSEAVSRRVNVFLKFPGPNAAAQLSCYIIYTKPPGANDCDCSAPEGSRCTAPSVEVKTVQAPFSGSVRIAPAPSQAKIFSFDPRTGGITIDAVDVIVDDPTAFSIDAFIDAPRKIRNTVGLPGRVKVCTPAGANVSGFVAC